MTNEIKLIQNAYEKIKNKYQEARQHFNRPLTLAEKILVGHMNQVTDEDGNQLLRHKSYVNFFPDRVAMQDATAQMALLQFMTASQPITAVPTTIHCDHLIQAERGAGVDLKNALNENHEVYEFLRTAANKYGMGFWKPGSGIIHQVVLENYAFPGGMMLGTDSHTPNAGGLGMIAIGVGGADAVDVMIGEPFSLRWPGVIGVKLTGSLSGWTSPKDVILKLMGILTVKGGTSCIVEFFGEGCHSISATGKGTICNMGAEHGATTSVFPYDDNMSQYLQATDRGEWANLADNFKSFLTADPEVYAEPEKFYDRVIHIDLNTLEPHIVGPHTPDLARPISEMKSAIAKEGYPEIPKAALIGSCTNSSYEDIGRAASIASAAAKAKLKVKIPFYITPGSETVHATVERDGLLKQLTDIDGVLLANACGPCIGQWHRTDIGKGENNAIISSYNRNFPGRNDGNRATLSFLASPEIVTAIALSGKLSFNPLKDKLMNEAGVEVLLPIPASDALPALGFKIDRTGYEPPAANADLVEVIVDPHSQRLALLKAFPKWSGKDFMSMPVLLKAKGKCTTDHISQAGVWLKYRGHLDQISNNTYIGAINAFSSETGHGVDVTNPTSPSKSYPDIARHYQSQHIDWMVIGDENFGEGSSREHAAMQPRHLGGKVIIARSFARIHETNLKKHGILPMTFINAADYDKFEALDRVDVVNLNQLAPKKPVDVILHHADGRTETIQSQHTLSEEQILWFKAGSALNYLAQKHH